MERNEKGEKHQMKVVAFNLDNTSIHIVPNDDCSRDGRIWIFESMIRRAEEKNTKEQKKKLKKLKTFQNGLFLV